MNISPRQIKQAGDTIIEVLFALLVVAVAIGIAYRVSTTSLRASRQAQERTTALKHVEGQIELIKAIADNPAATQNIYSVNNVYCIQPSGTYPLIEVDTSYASNTIKSLASDNLGTAYKPECIFDSLYHMSIEENSNQFSVVARWFRFGSAEKDEVRLEYRLYQ